MKILVCIIGIFLNWFTLFARKSKDFEIRGVLPKYIGKIERRALCQLTA